jgi:hypothetical protein
MGRKVSPPSRSELVLSIGGIAGRLSIAGAPQPFLAQVRARYDAFTMPNTPGVEHRFVLALDFQPARAPGRGPNPDIARHPLTVTVGPNAISVKRWDLDVRLTARTRAGRRTWTGAGRCRMSPFALDCLLRVLWSELLPREDGALIHSCGLRHAEIGVVFPGVSGQGKTTLARKAPDADDVLSDELIALRRTEDGWRVYGTPFWGDFARGGISMRSWPLRSLAFLAQRDEVVMSPVTSSEATLRLLSCLLCFQTSDATVRRNVALAARVCSEVRCVEAQLTRSASTAEIFSQLIPHLGPEVERKVPPYSTREMISEFRSFLRKHRTYAFSPRGASLRPFMQHARDSLLIQSVTIDDLEPGDIALYWTPGAHPDDDGLVCRRVGGHGALPGPRSELLGRVAGVAHDGRALPLVGRVEGLGRLFGAHVALPILRLAGR